MNFINEVNILKENDQSVSRSVKQNVSASVADTSLLTSRINLLIKQSVFHFSIRSFTSQFNIDMMTNLLPLIILSDKMLTILSKQILREIKKWPQTEINRLIRAIDLKFKEFVQLLNLNIQINPLSFFTQLFEDNGCNDNYENENETETEALEAKLTIEAKNNAQNFANCTISQWISNILERNLVEYNSCTDLIVQSEFFQNQIQCNLKKLETEKNETRTVAGEEESETGKKADDERGEKGGSVCDAEEKEIVLISTSTHPSQPPCGEQSDKKKLPNFFTKVHVDIQVNSYRKQPRELLIAI